MEATRNTPAIIIKRQSYREHDSLVVIYSLKYGQERLVARGTKKPQSKLAGHLEPISLADVMILAGKSGDYLASAISRDAYSGIKGYLNKLYYAGRALRWLSRLVKDREADERLFFLLGDWLEIIDDYPTVDFSKERGEILFSFFIWKFLALLGYQPEFHNCQSCRRQISAGENYFDLRSSGLNCRDCVSPGESRRPELVRAADNVIKLVRLALDSELLQSTRIKASRVDIQGLTDLINSFLKYNFEG